MEWKNRENRLVILNMLTRLSIENNVSRIAQRLIKDRETWKPLMINIQQPSVPRRYRSWNHKYDDDGNDECYLHLMTVKRGC